MALPVSCRSGYNLNLIYFKVPVFILHMDMLDKSRVEGSCRNNPVVKMLMPNMFLWYYKFIHDINLQNVGS